MLNNLEEVKLLVCRRVLHSSVVLSFSQNTVQLSRHEEGFLRAPVVPLQVLTWRGVWEEWRKGEERRVRGAQIKCEASEQPWGFLQL